MFEIGPRVEGSKYVRSSISSNEQYWEKTKDGTWIRLFEGAQCKYSVQVIYNHGVSDRRLKPCKREKRVILVRGVSREEAVSVFNAELKRRMMDD